MSLVRTTSGLPGGDHERKHRRGNRPGDIKAHESTSFADLGRNVGRPHRQGRRDQLRVRRHDDRDAARDRYSGSRVRRGSSTAACGSPRRKVPPERERAGDRSAAPAADLDLEVCGQVVRVSGNGNDVTVSGADSSGLARKLGVTAAALGGGVKTNRLKLGPLGGCSRQGRDSSRGGRPDRALGRDWTRRQCPGDGLAGRFAPRPGQSRTLIRRRAGGAATPPGRC